MASQWIYVGQALSGPGTRWSRIVPPRENLGGQARGSWLSQDRGLDVLIDPGGLALPAGRTKMTVGDFVKSLGAGASIYPDGPNDALEILT